MTDPILRKIHAETSEAVLRAMRSGCVKDGRWRDEHQAAYDAQIPKIKARWKRLRGE